uniref:WG repeat-containing protein n=1 Tax=candidate division WOR-3 bacterium TaxID=2052148 RepID=A0A7V3ZWQ0_UNCW3
MKERVIYGKYGPEYIVRYDNKSAVVYHIKDGYIGAVNATGAVVDKHGNFLGWNDIWEGVSQIIANHAAKKSSSW